jgi:lactoylglutathione lyase
MFREPFPILHVQDVERSARFYSDNFGFDQTFRSPEVGPLEFAFLQLGETGIGVASRAQPTLPDWPEGRETGSFELCIYTDDTDAAAERLRARGVKQLTVPREMESGEKLAFFEDPDGNLIHVTAVSSAPDGDQQAGASV